MHKRPSLCNSILNYAYLLVRYFTFPTNLLLNRRIHAIEFAEIMSNTVIEYNLSVIEKNVFLK